MALARFPENVRAEALADQADAHPSHATAELGEEMIIRVVQRVAKYVSEMIAGDRDQPVPEFHP